MTACSDDPDPKSDPDSSSSKTASSDASGTPKNGADVGTIDCPEFAEIGDRIVEAQTDLYAPVGEADPGAAIEELVAELDGLKEGAPGTSRGPSASWARASRGPPSSSVMPPSRAGPSS